MFKSGAGYTTSRGSAVFLAKLTSFVLPPPPPQCNNPQTKEPKLQAAVRIVAEWSDYDQEIKRIYNKFLEEKERVGVTSGNKTTPGSKTGEFPRQHLSILSTGPPLVSVTAQSGLWSFSIIP